jgi:hypothetical protein
MGCDVGAYGAGDDADEVKLNWSSAAYAVMALTSRWLVASRDCDDCHDQNRIDASAIAALHAEAPTDAEAFRCYCVKILGEKQAAELDDYDIAAIRKFVTKTAVIGKGAWCSY